MKLRTAKLLMLFTLVCGIGVFMPGVLLADGHGGHGHGHHGHDSGWGHTSLGFSFGLGYYGAGPYYYPSYPYSYAPGVVYVDPPAVPAAEIPAVVRYSKPAPAYDADLNKFLGDVKKTRFLSRLQQGDRAQRFQAIDLLAEFSSDAQVAAAFENILQSDPDASMRKAVVGAFARSRNQNSIAVLEKVKVDDSDLGVRQAAEMAINQIKS
jgi:hypothetical protein